MISLTIEFCRNEIDSMAAFFETYEPTPFINQSEASIGTDQDLDAAPAKNFSPELITAFSASIPRKCAAPRESPMVAILAAVPAPGTNPMNPARCPILYESCSHSLRGVSPSPSMVEKPVTNPVIALDAIRMRSKSVDCSSKSTPKSWARLRRKFTSSWENELGLFR